MTALATPEATTATEPSAHRASPGPVLLRAAGAVLLVYGYLVGLNVDLAPVRALLNRPLGIGEDFGVLGAMLLLAAAGYDSVTDRPVARRLLSAYLPAAVAVLLAAAAVTLGAEIWNTPAASHTSPFAVVGNLSLLSQLIAEKPLIVPLAWIVLLELLAIGTGALARRAGWVVPAAHVVLAATAVALVPDARAVTVAAFSAVVAIGQAVALTPRTRFAPALAVAAWGVLLLAERTTPELAKWWYPLTAAYAALLLTTSVLFAGQTAEKVAGHRVVTWLARHAVWLALLQGVVGFPVAAVAGVPAGVAATVCAAGAFGWAARRW
ncbi:hypothetical protein B0I31_105376 [Saccharothrix carnea]|uniref:Peptidoglycan/LPS O-acetylase OafA/YrhL n=1 Tax=Saccharothrix carnea TaxID=1280637 RepID=A0A2P8IAC7_SACCR|nr:hypothetical protein [Saccharothrix carnea]PSL55414.1 hypothetical protein B0I31_105376 [Saccharothrix carnea]